MVARSRGCSTRGAKVACYRALKKYINNIMVISVFPSPRSPFLSPIRASTRSTSSAKIISRRWMILLRDFHLSRHAAIPIRAPPFCTIIYIRSTGLIVNRDGQSAQRSIDFILGEGKIQNIFIRWSNRFVGFTKVVKFRGKNFAQFSTWIFYGL